MIIEDLKDRKPTIWMNPDLKKIEARSEISGEKFYKVKAAQNRLMRFFPYIESAFPETAPKKGLIESNVLSVPDFQNWMTDKFNKEAADVALQGRVFIKDDAHLPIAGSVKARGGIHEVLKHAEEILMKEGLIKPTDDYGKIDSDYYREILGKYTIQVGSTGNLGLSIGIMSAKLGFKVIVHMSSDAKTWKKELLRKKGVTVVEYDDDYSAAVAFGRKASDQDPLSYFVDDENSEDLFMGYATAALRLRMQFYNAQIPIDKEHPMFVYLPCGVGGAPSGITFGLKQVFGNLAHCFFVEPTEMPCFMYALNDTGKSANASSPPSVKELGLGGHTIADGLAVPKASAYCVRMMRDILSGAVTVTDEDLLIYQKAIYETENVFLEPSAVAGAVAVEKLHKSEVFKKYIAGHNLTPYMEGAVHVIWATGGGLVPSDQMWQ